MIAIHHFTIDAKSIFDFFDCHLGSLSMWL